MKALVCKMCAGKNFLKEDGIYICQNCGTQYADEETKKLLVDITESTATIDNSDFVQNCLQNARRAYENEDWEEVEKYYNLIKQNVPNNMEAVFFSAFGKAMYVMTEDDYYKKEKKLNALIKSISVINDYYEVTNEDKQVVLIKISDAIDKMYNVKYVYNKQSSIAVGGKFWHKNLFDMVKYSYRNELRQISALHNEPYLQELIDKLKPPPEEKRGCYVATAVYGSYDCPQVWTLRRYRDCTLSKTRRGRAFIRTYYAISPTLVKLFGETNLFKNLCKPILDNMVAKLNANGVKNTPYEDKEW